MATMKQVNVFHGLVDFVSEDTNVAWPMEENLVAWAVTVLKGTP